MNEIPSAAVKELIALGNLADGSSARRDELLTWLLPFERINRLGWKPWEAVADALSEVDLKNLVRGLTVADSEHQWCGGSVAGVIWTYRRYESRFPERAEELADWVLARSDNPHVPFGRMRSGSRSVVEYRAYLSENARRREESTHKQEDARQHKRIRAAVRKRLDQERRVLQAANSRVRAEIIAALQELPAKERLEHVAWDDFHSLEFFPASFAKVDSQTLKQLDSGTQKRLMDKMAARRKGVWKKLYEQFTMP